MPLNWSRTQRGLTLGKWDGTKGVFARPLTLPLSADGKQRCSRWRWSLQAKSSFQPGDSQSTFLNFEHSNFFIINARTLWDPLASPGLGQRWLFLETMPWTRTYVYLYGHWWVVAVPWAQWLVEHGSHEQHGFLALLISFCLFCLFQGCAKTCTSGYKPTLISQRALKQPSSTVILF